jgi:murein DD-endopeptidase MepM/ murein hydrolase activator NlpD
VVRPGDTLSQIAAMFDVSENTIRWANNIPAKSTIRPEQELIILPISGLKYVVKKGDTLKSIASAYNADTNEILSYNRIASAADLKVGAEIIIPNGVLASASSVNKPKTSLSGSTGTTAKSSGLIRPVKGGIKTQGLHGRNGVDIAAPLNTPVIAAANGKVIIAKQGGWNGGYGSYVVISHPNGIQTLYAHLNNVSVSAGQNISQGTKVGGMGSTGQSTGVHVHFEVRGGTNPF